MEFDHYIYAMLAVGIWMLGYFHTGRIVRPKWKLLGKFVFYVGVSLGFVGWINHYALVFILGHPLIGLIFHTVICRKYNIHWLTCEPEDQYIKLSERWAKGHLAES